MHVLPALPIFAEEIPELFGRCTFGVSLQAFGILEMLDLLRHTPDTGAFPVGRHILA
jgi:hypothetical protein